jgi:transmembrane sensor
MNSEERVQEIVAQEAADWFVANGEGLNDEQRGEFDRWLKRSPVNAEEYRGIAEVARELRAAADPGLSIETLIEQARSSDDEPRVVRIDRRVWRATTVIPQSSWRYAAAAAAVAILGVAVLWPRLHWMAPAPGPGPETVATLHFATGHGEQLTERLADASVLHLNTDTVVDVRYERAGRHVEIERGQVVFEVVHDPARPFRVRTGTAEVVDVGTKFDVYRQPGSTLVTVLEGRVTVAAITPGANANQGLVLVRAGEQVRVSEGAMPSSPAKVDARRATAWLRRQIAFEHEPLALVAAEFNRYASKPIEIETPALGALTVSGVFAADDTESFIAFLRSLDGVRVEVTATRIRVFKT